MSHYKSDLLRDETKLVLLIVAEKVDMIEYSRKSNDFLNPNTTCKLTINHN